MAGHLYILASRRHGTLDIGVTTDLPKRIYEHRNGLVPGFTTATASNVWRDP
jgi:putative endonuclease